MKGALRVLFTLLLLLFASHARYSRRPRYMRAVSRVRCYLSRLYFPFNIYAARAVHYFIAKIRPV